MTEKNTLPARSLRAIALTLVLTFLDQITKIWAVEALADGPFVLISGVFELRYLENHGAAFGILQDARVFFIVLTVAFLIFMAYIFVRVPATKRMLPIRILIPVVTAGAIGNFIDRLMLGYVRDFLYFSLINFPIFNVADIYVTVSAFVFFVIIAFYYKDDDFDFMKGKKHDGE